NGRLEGWPEVEKADGAGNGQRDADQLVGPKLLGAEAADGVLQRVVDADEQAGEQRDRGQPAAHDQREHAGGGVPLAEVGENVQAADDAENDDGGDVERDVAPGEEQGQLFAGAVDPRALASRRSMSCCIMSIGIGKTMTVLRSTPISVSVCK